MASYNSVFKRISLKDKITLGVIGLFLVGVMALMRMDTADWVFSYEDNFIEIRADARPPKLDFTLEQITEDSLRLTLDLTNISLVEFCAGEDQGLAKGHAHIFLDGKKQGSFFISQHTLTDLPKGRHTVTVSLNQPPTHKVLSWQGTPISLTKTFEIL